MLDLPSREQLLDEYGHFYGEERFAIAFTAGTEGANAKRVTTKEWDKTQPLPDGPFGSGLLSNRGLTRNPVVVLRPSNLIVLECDSEADLVGIQALALPTTITVRSSQPYKRHFYFRPPAEIDTPPYVAFRFEGGKLTADSGRYFLCPPAIHPSGAIYTFLPNLGPGEVDIAELPEIVYRDLAQEARKQDKTQRDQLAIDPEAKIREGSRRTLIFKFACMLLRWGLSEEEILEACREFNIRRCEPPVDDQYVKAQVSGAMQYQAGQSLVQAPDGLQFKPLEDFINTEEETVKPLVGTPDETMLPADGVLLMYGDGGAGKTTLSIDALAHIASATEWIGLEIPQAARVLLIENEGPRGQFRRRLARKVASWNGDPFTHNVHVLEEPWSRFTLSDENYRHELAGEIDRLEADLVMVGPLASIGAKGTGTPDEISEFDSYIRDLRLRSTRDFALWIVHHENKAGDVSGAWERLPDTMIHVQAQGNGRTRVFWRKVRWSSDLHQTTSQLIWGEGFGFQIEQKPERDYRQELLDHLAGSDEWLSVTSISRDGRMRREKVEEMLAGLRAENLAESISPIPGRKHNSVGWRLACPDPLGQAGQASRIDPVESLLVPPARPYKGQAEVGRANTQGNCLSQPPDKQDDGIPF